MEQSPEIGDRITEKSAPPDERAVRDWMGPPAFAHWVKLRSWIDASYPGVFAPEWRYGGKHRGWPPALQENQGVLHHPPRVHAAFNSRGTGGAEREKFEERLSLWRPELIKLYDAAKMYPDGRFLTVAISSAEDRHDVMDLLVMKRPPTSTSAGKSPLGAKQKSTQ